MGFELKDASNESVYKDNLTPQDFEKKGFRTESIDLALPNGTVKGTQWFFDGIKMSYFESELNTPTVFDWKGDVEMVTMHFNLQGKVSMRDQGMGRAFELSANQHNIFYGKEAEGQMNVEELSAKLFLIQLSKNAFLNMAAGGNDAIKQFAGHV
ncbi:MAG TPA: AraC family transcriptional regulator, partial [Bacteroidia bacterium]|nr:AraC family transcriptional regulator [Bacteroidia bacterium]